MKITNAILITTLISSSVLSAENNPGRGLSNQEKKNTVNTHTFSPAEDSAVKKIVDAKVPFTFSGYVDANYFKNLNNPKDGLNTGLSGMARAFDQRENQFQLGLAQTKFSFSRSKADAVIDLTFGPHADLGNYGNKIGPFGLNVGTSALNIKQAYIVWKINSRHSFTMGQFGTHIGMEVIESSINYHYSLSNLFNNGPFYHQGLKYTHTLNDKFAVMVGAVNNWDNLYDNNRFKSAIAQIAITPKKGYSFYLNYIGGNEDNIVDSTGATSWYGKDTVHNMKQMLDFVANLQLTDKLYFGVNAAFGSSNNTTILTSTDQKKAYTWGGVAAYINCSFTDKVSFGVRGELFDNTAGVQYIGKTDVQSYTATFNFKLDDGNLILRPEYRMDIYKTNPNVNGVKATQQFMDSDGNFTKASQSTVGMAMIYKF
jgi:hypothetical protein